MAFLTVEIASILLFFISFYELITGNSIMKSIISIGLMETAVVVFFLSIGYSDGNIPPIGHNFQNVSDPFPQSLVITAIIIGVAVSAINLTMFNTLCKQFKTANWDILDNKKME